MHEHDFSGLDVGAHEQGVSRGQSGRSDSRSLLEQQRIRKLLHGGGIACHVLSIGSRVAFRQRSGYENAIARVDAADIFADGIDNSRSVGSWRVGQCGKAGIVAFPDIRFDRVYPGGKQLDAHFAALRIGYGNRLRFQHGFVAEFRNDDSLHVHGCSFGSSDEPIIAEQGCQAESCGKVGTEAFPKSCRMPMFACGDLRRRFCFLVARAVFLPPMLPLHFVHVHIGAADQVG